MAFITSKVFRLAPRQLTVGQKRYRSKINIQKPRKPHYIRGVFNKFLTPFYPIAREKKPIWELCDNLNNKKKVIREPNQYEQIIARECLNWFKNSRMIAFLHENSIRAEEQLDMAIALRRANMYVKYYGYVIHSAALSGTVYEAALPLLTTSGKIVFSPEPNVIELLKIIRQTPQMILMAGILDGKLLNLNDFLKYGKMDLDETRCGLIQTLQTAAGRNLCRQLTHHQSTFVSRLDQIHKDKIKTDEIDKSTGENETIAE